MADAFKGVIQFCLFFNISRINILRVIFLGDIIDVMERNMKVLRKSAARHIDPDRGFICNQEDKELSEKEKGAEAQESSFATRNAWSCTKRAYRQKI